ncbi:nucleotidyltransferase substrate binding protein [Persephonella sp.]|uniref:nucleotidyltransferase substrate binding protein n=1 Tax=Persephonella sp. TaxID=2060922 RepID=UPI002629FB97|nr:nucleotidyltransferase substrate binding protein [Persephonella sp.]
MACGERVLRKLTQSEKAFEKLKEIESLADELEKEILYEVSAKRFEYTFESLWKTIKVFLEEEKGIGCNSPMDCFKQFYKTMNLDEQYEDKIPKTVRFRNEIVHIYDYETAEFIYHNLEDIVVPLFGEIIDKIRNYCQNKGG